MDMEPAELSAYFWAHSAHIELSMSTRDQGNAAFQLTLQQAEGAQHWVAIKELIHP